MSKKSRLFCAKCGEEIKNRDYVLENRKPRHFKCLSGAPLSFSEYFSNIIMLKGRAQGLQIEAWIEEVEDEIPDLID